MVAANILGPLLVRFAGEIAPYVGRKIIISGILTELYPDVLAAFAALGFEEQSSRTIGEWTTGLLRRADAG
jgi:ribosomal protein L11 methylase PrmA